MDEVGIPVESTFLQWNMNLGDTFETGTGIAFDIGLPGLGLETTGAIKVVIDWDLAFGFGINFTDGFYLDVSDSNELEVSVEVTVPGGGITGKLAILQISATDNLDGVITGQVVIGGTVDSNTLGTYTLTYNVTDSDGNAATTATRTVNVKVRDSNNNRFGCVVSPTSVSPTARGDWWLLGGLLGWLGAVLRRRRNPSS